jgi:hypothetical protein
MRTYRYVHHKHIERFLATGWIPCLPSAPSHHCRHAIIMRACACHGGEDAR